MNHDVVTVSEMKELERKAAISGLSYYQMMENAGTKAYNYIKATAHKVKNVVVFCGKGNNGGDGFVVARKFKKSGANVRIILISGQPKTEDAKKNMELCLALNIPIEDSPAKKDYDAEIIASSDIIVDAIFGTGFHGGLNQTARIATQIINQANAQVFALDIPSGLNGDSAQAAEDAVHADYTIAFHRYKPVHLASESKPYCGKLTCVDIGIPF